MVILKNDSSFLLSFNHGVYQHGWSFLKEIVWVTHLYHLKKIYLLGFYILDYLKYKNIEVQNLSKNLDMSNEVYYGFFFERKLRKINYGFSIANNLDNNDYLQFSIKISIISSMMKIFF